MPKPEYNIKVSPIPRIEGGLPWDPCPSFNYPESCQYWVQCFSGYKHLPSESVPKVKHGLTEHLAPEDSS